MIEAARAWKVKDYINHSNVQYKDALSLLKDVTFFGSEKVIDVGCGDGKITADIAQLVPAGKVIGLDSSSEMVGYAKSTHEETRHNLIFQHGDVQSWSQNTDIDLVTSFSCLHWVDNIQAAVKNIYTALKHGGNFRAFYYPKCEYQWAAIDEVIASERWKNFFIDFVNTYKFYSEDFFSKLLKQVGFREADVFTTETSYVTYNSLNDLVNFMKGWLPHVHQVPECNIDHFMTEVCNKYVRNLGCGVSNSIQIPFRKVIVFATK